MVVLPGEDDLADELGVAEALPTDGVLPGILYNGRLDPAHGLHLDDALGEALGELGSLLADYRLGDGDLGEEPVEGDGYKKESDEMSMRQYAPAAYKLGTIWRGRGQHP